MNTQLYRHSVAARSMSHKLYSIVYSLYSTYAAGENNLLIASHADLVSPSLNSLVAFFGSARTSRRESNASRLSIIQRVTIAAAHASTQASISTRRALAKLLERFNSTSSASSSERFEAFSRNSSGGMGMGLLGPLGTSGCAEAYDIDRLVVII